jgi:hypothetical protein
MRTDAFHLSDEQILSEMDGEIPASERKQIRLHLDTCWKCRARRLDLESAITGFIHVYEREFEAKLPPAAGPRALLKAQLDQLSSNPSRNGGRLAFGRLLPWAVPAGLCAVLIAAFLLLQPLPWRQHRHVRSRIVSTPEPTITPGAALPVSGPAVCAEDRSNNKLVPAALQRKVLEEYGLADSDAVMYEIDYLVTPALGGSDDIRNLWPHSYAATVWNAKVKDALESLLRQKVCDGKMDLATAQREIAGNWIGAYKKYFETETPLPQHER